MKRFNNPHSTGERKEIEWKRKYKQYDESITDKSSFTTLTDQLKKIAPMTNDEINSHFDFIKGSKDDGRSMPLRQGYDIAELQESIKNKQKTLKKKVDSAAKEAMAKAEAKALSESIENQIIK